MTLDAQLLDSQIVWAGTTLGSRARNALTKRKLNTRRKILEFGQSGWPAFKAVKNFGRTSYDELDDWLAHDGLSFSMELPPPCAVVTKDNLKIRNDYYEIRGDGLFGIILDGLGRSAQTRGQEVGVEIPVVIGDSGIVRGANILVMISLANLLPDRIPVQVDVNGIRYNAVIAMQSNGTPAIEIEVTAAMERDADPLSRS